MLESTHLRSIRPSVLSFGLSLSHKWSISRFFRTHGKQHGGDVYQVGVPNVYAKQFCKCTKSNERPFSPFLLVLKLVRLPHETTHQIQAYVR